MATDAARNIAIDADLQKLLPPPTAQELAELEASIIADGIREPLIVWRTGRVLVDGHNRLRIAEKHGLPYRVTELDFADHDAARQWVIRNQLSRRNLTPDAASYLRGLLVRAAPRDSGARTDRTSSNSLTRLQAMADEHGVTRQTLHNDAVFADAVDAIAEAAGDDARPVLLSGKVAKKDVLQVAKLPAEQQAEVIRRVQDEGAQVKAAVRDVSRQEAAQLADEVAATEDTQRQAAAVEHGQWWSLSRHLLFCGDSSGDEFVQRAQSAAFAFADPPYGEAVGEWDGAFVWDHDWLADAATVVAVTPGIANLLTFARLTEMPYKWTFACWINNGMTRGEMGFGNYIVAPLFSHGSIYRNAQDFMQVSISIAETSETDHRGRKPTGLVARLMELYSEQGQTVIDPFLGSGTTLLVAEKLGRACIGAEIVPEFCSQIIARWEGLTGEKAVLLPGEVREAA